MGAVVSGVGNILIRIGAETASAVRDIGNVDKALGETMTTSQKATAGLKKAAVPAAIAFAAIGAAAIDCTKAALDDAAAQDKLAGVLHRVAGATDAQVKGTEDYITKLELSTGVMDDELRPAMSKLATATGDVTEAQKALGIATDISAQTGKSMESVSTALAKAYSGNTGALKKLNLGLDDATLKGGDMSKIMDEISQKTGGAAKEAASTAAGSFKVWGAQVQELKESLGSALIPVIQAFMPLLQGATAFVADHTKAVEVLVGIIATLAGGILVANAALKAYEAIQTVVKVATAAWTAAQWLLNAALDANPIGLIIIAIAALAAGIVIAYKKSETFRDIVHAALALVMDAVHALGSAFDALLGAASSAWNWIADHWKLGALALGPLGVAIVLIATHFDELKDAAARAFGAVLTALNSVVDAITGAIGAVKDLIDWLGKIHVPSIHIPNPFSASLAGVPTVGLRASGAGGAVGATVGSAAGTTINVFGAVDPEGTARAIQRVLRAHDRRQGR